MERGGWDAEKARGVAWGGVDLLHSQEGQENTRGSEGALGRQQKWDTLSNTFTPQMEYEKALIAVGGHLCYRRAHKGERRSTKTHTLSFYLSQTSTSNLCSVTWGEIKSVPSSRH